MLSHGFHSRATLAAFFFSFVPLSFFFSFVFFNVIFFSFDAFGAIKGSAPSIIDSFMDSSAANSSSTFFLLAASVMRTPLQVH